MWSPYTKQNTDFLEMVLRHARWACGSHFDSSAYHWSPSASECCDRLKWHILATHRDITCLFLVHNIIHNDSYLLNINLASLQGQPDYDVNPNYDVDVNVPFILNKLDSALMKIANKSVFKKKLYYFMLVLYLFLFCLVWCFRFLFCSAFVLWCIVSTVIIVNILL